MLISSLDAPSENPAAFDTTLPATHKYLGDVEPVSGLDQTITLNPGTLVMLPLILLPDVVLFPGQKLPLRLFDQEKVQHMLKLTMDGVTKMFGVVFLMEGYCLMLCCYFADFR